MGEVLDGADVLLPEEFFANIENREFTALLVALKKRVGQAVALLNPMLHEDGIPNKTQLELLGRMISYLTPYVGELDDPSGEMRSVCRDVKDTLELLRSKTSALTTRARRAQESAAWRKLQGVHLGPEPRAEMLINASPHEIRAHFARMEERERLLARVEFEQRHSRDLRISTRVYASVDSVGPSSPAVSTRARRRSGSGGSNSRSFMGGHRANGPSTRLAAVQRDGATSWYDFGRAGMDALVVAFQGDSTSPMLLARADVSSGYQWKLMVGTQLVAWASVSGEEFLFFDSDKELKLRRVARLVEGLSPGSSITSPVVSPLPSPTSESRASAPLPIPVPIPTPERRASAQNTSLNSSLNTSLRGSESGTELDALMIVVPNPLMHPPKRPLPRTPSEEERLH